MTKSLFKIQSVTNKQTKTKTPNFCFSGRRAAADLTKLSMKIEDVRTIFAPP